MFYISFDHNIRVQSWTYKYFNVPHIQIIQTHKCHTYVACIYIHMYVCTLLYLLPHYNVSNTCVRHKSKVLWVRCVCVCRVDYDDELFELYSGQLQIYYVQTAKTKTF